MKLSIGIIFVLILVWSGIFSFIFVVYRMMLLPDSRSHVVDLFDIEVAVTTNSSQSNGIVDRPTADVKGTALSIHTSSALTETKRKYAYVTLLHGIDDTFSYRGFLYNCFIVKKALVAQNSTADFIVLIGFTYGVDPKVDKITKDLALLQKFGIILYYLPRLDNTLTNEEQTHSNTEQTISQKSNKNKKKIPFLEMALLKIIPWSFTQYEKIQFFDGDVFPHRNMDCFFQLSVNTFNTGNASPLNSGWFVAIPNITDYHTMRTHAITRMYTKWDERKGWGEIIPADLTFRGGKRAVQKWGFNGASLDQGLLTHYFVLQQGRVQLIDVETSAVPVQVYHAGYQHKGSTLAEALHCCTTSTSTNNIHNTLQSQHAPLAPSTYFHHYTGRSKPWLQDLTRPKDAAQRLWAQYLDELKISVNSSNINKQGLNSPLGYFYPNK